MFGWLMGGLVGIIINTQRTWSRTGLQREGRSLQEIA